MVLPGSIISNLTLNVVNLRYVLVECFTSLFLIIVYISNHLMIYLSSNQNMNKKPNLGFYFIYSFFIIIFYTLISWSFIVFYFLPILYILLIIIHDDDYSLWIYLWIFIFLLVNEIKSFHSFWSIFYLFYLFLSIHNSIFYYSIIDSMNISILPILLLLIPL